MEKARKFQKNTCFINYSKAFDYVDRYKMRKILKEMGVPLPPSGQTEFRLWVSVLVLPCAKNSLHTFSGPSDFLI